MDHMMDRLGKGMVLTEEEEDLVIIPQDTWTGNVTQGGYYLVGRLLSPRSYRLEYLRDTFTSVINPGKGMDMREISTNRYLFRFNHPVDRNRTMEKSPWNFDKNILILNEIELDDNPQDIDLNWCAFFIQVQGLPLRQMTTEIARYIGDRLGKFIEVDQGGQGWGSTMRIRVLLDVRQPLKRILKLRSSTGESQQVWFLYERLPNFCYICGVLGHIAKSCPKQYEEEYVDPGENTQYGPWMRAPTPRPVFRRTTGISKGTMEGSGRGYGGPSMRGTAIFDHSPTLTPITRSGGETSGIENQSVPILTEKHNNTHASIQHGGSGNIPLNEEIRSGLTTTQPDHNSQPNKLTPQFTHQSTQLSPPIQPTPNPHPLQPGPYTPNPQQPHPNHLNPPALKQQHQSPLLTNPSPQPNPTIHKNDPTILPCTSPNPTLHSTTETPHVNHINQSDHSHSSQQPKTNPTTAQNHSPPQQREPHHPTHAGHLQSTPTITLTHPNQTHTQQATQHCQPDTQTYLPLAEQNLESDLQLTTVPIQFAMGHSSGSNTRNTHRRPVTQKNKVIGMKRKAKEEQSPLPSKKLHPIDLTAEVAEQPRRSP